ncbi:MAG: ATP-binding protein [Clostridia bacterium]|nr:ATP-binding protein [Clostridia bacterium]
MGYSAEIYRKASQILERRRADAETLAARRRAEVYAAVPQIRQLDAHIAQTGLGAVRAIGMKQDAQKYLDALKEENLAAQQKKRELLLEAGYPEDYLRVKYTCEKCSDSGFCGGYRCACMDALARQIAYSALCSDFPLDKCTFERFNPALYSKQTDPKTGVAPYARMEEIFRFCQQYAADFDLRSPSLFLYGETGLGKTHLSLAIAGEVTKKGFGVIYGSAQNLLDRLERERFKGENEGAQDAMLECDLLILDDLGAEFTTQFTTAAVYNIINTRLQSGRPVIINTNLTIKELEKRYTRRITSRIFGSYTTLTFYGADIRQILR